MGIFVVSWMDDSNHSNAILCCLLFSCGVQVYP